MDDFTGVLICSDLDGTLAQGLEISERNYAAINHFIKCGGHFTVSTGRDADYLCKLPRLHCNAPLICINGAQIYDAENGKILFYKVLDASYLNAVQYAFDRFGSLNFCNFFLFDGKQSGKATYLRTVPCEMPRLNAQKAVMVFSDEKETLDCKNALCERFPDFGIFRSWATGLEILPSGADKGICAEKLKKLLGAHTLLCIGDYENDLPMLRKADFAFAPKNALQSVKDASDYTLCTVTHGAVSDLIERLPRLLAKRKSAHGK